MKCKHFFDMTLMITPAYREENWTHITTSGGRIVILFICYFKYYYKITEKWELCIVQYCYYYPKINTSWVYLHIH